MFSKYCCFLIKKLISSNPVKFDIVMFHFSEIKTFLTDKFDYCSLILLDVLPVSIFADIMHINCKSTCPLP